MMLNIDKLAENPREKIKNDSNSSFIVWSFLKTQLQK